MTCVVEVAAEDEELVGMGEAEGQLAWQRGDEFAVPCLDLPADGSWTAHAVKVKDTGHAGVLARAASVLPDLGSNSRFRQPRAHEKIEGRGRGKC